VLRVREFGWRKFRPCGWGATYWDHGDAVWHCSHEEACSGCGKVLRTSVTKLECPEYHEITSEETAAVQADYARRAELIARTRRMSRSAVTGPQGYRKPKEKK
jgi:hypothetical protein